MRTSDVRTVERNTDTFVTECKVPGRPFDSATVFLGQSALSGWNSELPGRFGGGRKLLTYWITLTPSPQCNHDTGVSCSLVLPNFNFFLG
jgi:hypothetical protein